MAVVFPVIGNWFRRPNGTVFEVVAVDETAGTVEIQQVDGTVDEYDLDAWPDLLITEASAPKDLSGSFDMDPEDFSGHSGDEIPPGFHDPLDFLDQLDR